MSAPGFARLVEQTGPGDLSKLLYLRALVDCANDDGTAERAHWLAGVREAYRRGYAGHPESIPADDVLDEHVVRTLAVDGVLEPVAVPGADDGPDPAGEVPWHAVRLSTWAAAEVGGGRHQVLDLLDARIRAILEHTDDAGPSAGVVDLPPAPALDGPAMHEAQPPLPEHRVPGGLLVPGGATLAAKGLVKVYRKRRVVNEVDLHVSQGEIVGLLGPNGAGKTTSFYMMVGLIRPDKGKVFIGQRDLTGVPMFRRARAGIGYLAQEPSIFRKLTVEENVMAILQMMKIKRADRKARLEQLLDELSIKHLRKTRAYALSGGERRRLEITRALVGNPKFMLLDEPFAGVDPIAVHDIQQIVSDLRRRGIGVLISDHNVEQTLDIVDRAYIMYDGRVRVSGTVSELVWNEEVAEIYLGPTLTARMRERYPNPHAAPAVGGADADFAPGGDEAQWAAGGAWGTADDAPELAETAPTETGSGEAASMEPAWDEAASLEAGSAEPGSMQAVPAKAASAETAPDEAASVEAVSAGPGSMQTVDGGRPRAAAGGDGPAWNAGDAEDDERDGAEHGPGTHG